MRKTISVFIVLGLFLFGLVAAGQAQDHDHGQAKAKDKVKKEKTKSAGKSEKMERTGVLEVQAAKPGEKYSTVLLKVGEESYKLIPAKKAKGIMAKLEALSGKEVTVQGFLLPADEKHPLAAISVAEFNEGKSTAPASLPAASPAGVHSKGEHPAGEHPKSEHPSSEHPHGH